MNTHSFFTVAHGLRNELEVHTPDVWASIKGRLAREVANKLLKELSGLPSLEGRLLFELRNSMTEDMKARKHNLGA